MNGTLFFTADDGTTGRELWKSDGTAAGTVLVKDINPGSASSDPSYLTNVNGTLFFTADDGTGVRSSGRATAPPPAPCSSRTSSPDHSRTSTARCSSRPTTGLMATELWTLAEDGLPSVTIGDATVTEGHTGTQSATFTVTLSAASDQPVTVAYATANGTPPPAATTRPPPAP